MAAALFLATGCGGGSSGGSPPPLNNTTNATNVTQEPQNNTTNVSNSTGSGSTTNAAENSTSMQNTSNSSQGGSQPADASAFPTIVQQAMTSLGENGFQGADAPTYVPQPAGGGSTSYNAHNTQPSAHGPQFLVGYHVDLLTGGQPYASYEVDHFVSTSQAASSISSFASAVHGGAMPSGGTGIVLPNNHSAQMATVGNSTVVYWSDNGWNFQVVNENTSVPPTPIVDKLVSALSSTSLPATDGVGRVIVDNQNPSGMNVTVTVIWSQKGNVYEVQTTNSAASPIQSALQMAGSMRSYWS
ncbi:hypothetical protein TC41_0431 [Alicyclobacillus acidocaldarius subsp. acidocaldarius Tc-4-1]|uniref:Uncharacterized protein n=1 Tax=Alicyclobacillus acidocaldarius (strain Tc-4-1) TaxID=1048834 RepID=F8IL17_ALIAT|nr:hypothetical protein TC41_0431 [Alicyclobacillus acidocaldarius subsp. acidocaldarius Tc-4-1]